MAVAVVVCRGGLKAGNNAIETEVIAGTARRN
jgi:hypothetical protein